MGAERDRDRGVDPFELPTQITRFVGRQEELAQLRPLLRGSRLLTLTGVGGIGKTRLALELAAAVQDEYPDGVRLVQAAALASAALLPQQIATAIGAREPASGGFVDHLANLLRERQALIVLDNCEHVVDGAAELVETLLRAAPGLTVLATSRERLGVPGETAWRVPALSFPAPARVPPLAELGTYEALRLFIERAAEARPGFSVTTATEAAALCSVASHLDGIPLALELAAVQVRVLTVEELAERLDDRFRLLARTRPSGAVRHHTLRASMDWSYDLLSDTERRLFRQLSVFAGGWTVAAAEAIGDGEVFEPLAHLVEKSLVQTQHLSGVTRYFFLDTVRQYAAERLAETDEGDVVRARHADYFAEMAEQARHALERSGQRHWMERLDLEHNNMRAAAAWLHEHGDAADLALRLASGLVQYWSRRGYLGEGIAWLQAALHHDGPPSLARAWALRGLGGLLLTRDASSQAAGVAALREAASLFAVLGDSAGQARALINLAMALAIAGELVQAASLFRESRAVARQAGDRWAEAYGLRCLGCTARLLGDLELAKECFSKALRLFDSLGEQIGRAQTLTVMAGVEEDAGRVDGAIDVLCEALRTFAQLDDSWGIMLVFWHLSSARARNKAFLSAARLIGATQALQERMGAEPPRFALAGQDNGARAIRARLGPVAFDSAVAEGRGLALSDAIHEALNPALAAAAVRETSGPKPKLTAREWEIARLIGDGLTNRQMAERLVISERTADAHVQNILAKLGCARRTEVWRYLVH